MSAFDDLEAELKDVEGYFLDSWNALQEFASRNDNVSSKRKTPTGVVWSELVEDQFACFSNSNISPQRIVLHHTETDSFKKRNSTEGKNHLLLGRMVIVTLYQFWDGSHRPRIAKMIGVATKELNVPIFGDIRLIRNAIIHKNGIFDKNAEDLEVVKWLAQGDEISIDIDRFTSILSAIRSWLRKLPKVADS